LVSGRFVEGRHPICGCDQEAQLVKACDQPEKCAAIDAAHFPSAKAGFRDFEGDHRDDLWVTAARSTMPSLRLLLSPTPERTDRDRVDVALWRRFSDMAVPVCDVRC
jgi:hypothetical protein